jgi:dihydrofolate reductase
MARPFDLLLGRKTYEIFAAHWPYSEEPGAEQLNQARKYVASRTLNQVAWRNSTLIKGDVVQEVKKLKQQDGPEIQVHGSSNLIQTLLKSGLIDELRVWIFPVLVGQGKRLFDQGTMPSSLKLTGSKTSSTGVILATYVPGGELTTGSFALDQPTEAERSRRKSLAEEG